MAWGFNGVYFSRQKVEATSVLSPRLRHKVIPILSPMVFWEPIQIQENWLCVLRRTREAGQQVCPDFHCFISSFPVFPRNPGRYSYSWLDVSWAHYRKDNCSKADRSEGVYSIILFIVVPWTKENPDTVTMGTMLAKYLEQQLSNSEGDSSQSAMPSVTEFMPINKHSLMPPT